MLWIDTAQYGIHERLISNQLELMHALGFFKVVQNIDFHQSDYLSFYNVYLKEFADEQYTNTIKRMQFLKLALDFKLFNHLQQLKEVIENNKDSSENIELWVKDRIDRMLVDREIETRLDANFLQVITDIDILVKEEYLECTGKRLKSAVFDKEKIGEQIEEVIEDKDIGQELVNDYHKKSSRELADAFLNLVGIPTFEKGAAVTSTDEFGDSLKDDPEILFSSYPVEMAERENLT